MEIKHCSIHSVQHQIQATKKWVTKLDHGSGRALLTYWREDSRVLLLMPESAFISSFRAFG